MSEDAGKGKKSTKSRNVGQLIERGKDKFLIRVYVGRDSTGKRHYHNETFHGKKKDAQTYRRQMLTKLKNGEPLTLGNDTLSTFIDEWLQAHPDLKESSIEHYRRTVDYYVRPTLGKLLLSKIHAAEVQSLYDDLLKR